MSDLSENNPSATYQLESDNQNVLVDEPMKKKVSFNELLVSHIFIVNVSKEARAARNGSCYWRPQKPSYPFVQFASY